MAITLPVTAAQIKAEIIANVNNVTTVTPISMSVDSNGKVQTQTTQKPDLTPDAIADATAKAVYTTLTAILNSTSINVSGVL